MQQTPTEELKPAMFIRHAVASDVGLKRAENQDSFKIIQHGDLNIFLVADGMGGAQGGKMASEMAVNLFEQAVNGKSNLNEADLQQIILEIHQTILERSESDPDLKGMGTTLVGMSVDTQGFRYFNVGDSRLYHISGDHISGWQIEKLTKDHTVVQELLNNGAISDEQAKNHPVAHMLTRSLGASSDLAVDTFELQQPLKSGDKFLLCSDGLHGAVDSGEILEAVRNNPLPKAVSLLIEMANQRGGKDNVTVLMVEFSSVEERVPVDSSVNVKITVTPKNKLRTFLIIALVTSLMVLTLAEFFADKPLKVADKAPLLQVSLQNETKELDKALEAADENLRKHPEIVDKGADLLSEIKEQYSKLDKSQLLQELESVESERKQHTAELKELTARLKSAQDNQRIYQELSIRRQQLDALSLAAELKNIMPEIGNYVQAFHLATDDYLKAIESKRLRDTDPHAEQNFQRALRQRNESLTELKSVANSFIENGLSNQQGLVANLPVQIKVKQNELEILDKRAEELRLFLLKQAVESEP